MALIFVNAVRKKLSLILSIFILSSAISPVIMQAGFCDKFSNKSNNLFLKKYPKVVSAALVSVRKTCGPVAADSFKKFIDGALVGTGATAGIVLAIIILWKLYLKKMINDSVDENIAKAGRFYDDKKADLKQLKEDTLKEVSEFFIGETVELRDADGNVIKKSLLKKANDFVDVKKEELKQLKVDILKEISEFVVGEKVEQIDANGNIIKESLFKKTNDLVDANIVKLKTVIVDAKNTVNDAPGKMAKALLLDAPVEAFNRIVSASKEIGSLVMDKFKKTPINNKEVLNEESEEVLGYVKTDCDLGDGTYYYE